MKYIKKIILLFSAIGLIFICACNNILATDSVREYLEKYKNQNPEILTQLDSIIEQNEFTEKQQFLYRALMKRQYKDLEYEILEEKYDGNKAMITTKITVYNLFKVQKDANLYLEEHQEEFLNSEKKHDQELFLDYKLEKMNKTTDRVSYTIVFNVDKKDGNWILQSLNHDDLEKIHGVYDSNLEKEE